MHANDARYDDEPVRGDQVVTELLLAAADCAGSKPVRVWNVRRLHSVHVCCVDLKLKERVGHRVQSVKALVDRNLDDAGSRVERSVDDSPTD